MSLLRFFRRARWDEERARELEAYLAQETDDNIARGMDPDAARAAAHRKLGNPTRIREEIYTMNSLSLLETIWHDLRYGTRLLRRSPGFALVAIMTLALGAGATTAMFQLVDAVRLRGIPVEHPEDVVEVRIVKAPNGRTGSFFGRWPTLSYPLYRTIAEEQRVLTGLAAFGPTTFDLAPGGERRPVNGLWVSGNFFPLLGLHAAAGRLLTQADDTTGCAAPGAVLGHAFWQREYGGDRAAIGRSLLLDGHRFDIVGVAARDFSGLESGRPFDVAIPLCAEPMVSGAERTALDKSDIWFLAAVGRLAPGQTIEQLNAHLAALSKTVMASTVSPRYSAADAKDYLEMVIGAREPSGGPAGVRFRYQDSLNILLAGTALVLLIACANLANLMLARGTAREREVAVRLAIGASRVRIVRQLLSESLLIAALGAASGAIAAQWLSRSLVSFISTPEDPLSLDLGVDWRLLAFTIALASTACLLFGLAPSLRVTATSPAASIKGGRGTTDGERFGIRRALVVLQVALSLVLVVGALLFVRTLRNLTEQNLGFTPDGVLVAAVDMANAGIPATARPETNRRIVEELRAVPGVTAVAHAFTTPLSGMFWNNRILVGGVVQQDVVNFNSIGAGYFQTLGIPLVAGRDFDARETPASPPAALVNQSFARKYFTGREAIGQSFQVEAPPGAPRPFIEVVGVVADTKYSGLREAGEAVAYLAATQNEKPLPVLSAIVRSSLPSSTLTPAMTQAIARVNPSIKVRYQELRAQIEQSLTRERLMARLSTSFGGLAMLIATIGLYGVMSYMVARRRKEIAVRMALGADPGALVRMIAREAGVLLLLGLAIGAPAAAYAGRSAASFLYQLKPWDPLTFLLAGSLLAVVSMLASWLPAHRAASVAPTLTLHEE